MPPAFPIYIGIYKIQCTMQAVSLMDSEGLVTGLYRHLWMTNPRGESANVNLPNTVRHWIKIHEMNPSS